MVASQVRPVGRGTAHHGPRRARSVHRAALNLDGIPQYGALLDSGSTRPFLMLYTERPGRVGASDVIYAHTSAPYWRAVLAQSRHLDPSDWPLYGPTLHQGGGFGSVAPLDTVRLTNRPVREYFHQTLRGRRSPLLAGARLSGLTVASMNDAARAALR